MSLRRVFVGLAVLGALAATPASAVQQVVRSDMPKVALRELAADSVRPLRLRQHAGAGIPYLVTGRIPIAKFSSEATATGRARDFWSAYGNAFGVRDPGSELRLRATRRDALGMTHLRYEQRYRGLPVWGRELVLHLDQGAVRAVNGEFTPRIDLSTEPRVSRGEAGRIARASLAKLQGRVSQTDSALAVFVDSADRAHLAWEVVVPTGRPLGLWRVFVDAHSGTVLLSYDDLQTARNRETYTNGNDADCNTEIAPQCVLPGVLQRTELACIPGPACPDAVLNATHTNTGAVYDYYQGTHGRDSYDGAGHTMRSTVHFGSSYNNAFWCNDDCAADFGSLVDGEQMAYGDGDGAVFNPLGQALDIVGHELTHGFIDGAAGLQYVGQSGALNESMADFFGVQIEPGDWLVGEDVYTPGTPGDALRSLADPPLFGQPGHMNQYVHTIYDNGGVHINSGIPNKAAYLTSEASGYGIGRADTEDILYRVVEFYATPTTDFVENLAYQLTAAEDLFGVGSAEARAVARANAAVGLVLPPAVIFPNGGENLVPGSSQTATWSTEDTGLPFAVDLLRVSPSTTYNEGFEGSALLPPGFTTSGDAPWTVTTANPGAGARSAAAGVIGHNQRSELSFTKTMSAPGNVSFMTRFNTEQDFDFFTFYVDGELRLFAHGNSGGWVPTPPVPVSAGTHLFTFVYEQDEIIEPLNDGVAVDTVVVPNVENVVRTPITAATAPGATSQGWTAPNEVGDYKVRVTSLGEVAPWLASDDSDAIFRVGSPPAPTCPTDGLPPVGAIYAGMHQGGGTVCLVLTSDFSGVTRFRVENVPGNFCDFTSAQRTFTPPLPLGPGRTFSASSASGLSVSGSFPGAHDANGTLRVVNPPPFSCDSGSLTWNATTNATPPWAVPPPPPPPPGTAGGGQIIIGTPGNDLLTGTPGPDFIRGLGGNDVIRGLGGNDRIEGGAGNDRVDGGGGNDTIIGQAGNDVLNGQGGRDKIIAKNAGTDRLNGGPGRDAGSWNKKDRAKSIEKRLR